jgi:hypothetical protein
MYRAVALAWALVGSLLSGDNARHASISLAHDYKGPIANGGVWADAFQLAKDAVQDMTLEEKVRSPIQLD